MNTITLNIDGRAVEAMSGDTVLEASLALGVEIPTLCHMKGKLPTGSCRMCVVEVDGRHGLIPSCSQPAEDGMVVRTRSARVLEARRTIVELLLAAHPDDCLYCARSGDCTLQDLAIQHEVRGRKLPAPAEVHPLDISSPSIIRDPAKCVLCGKCVRVCEETMGIGAIDFTGRGSSTCIAPAFLDSLNASSCVHCGQCVQVCPTGALTEQDHLEQVWEALVDPELTVAVQHAPSVSVSIAELFGLPAGQDETGRLNAALRLAGFDIVCDTAFAADLTVMEEAAELVTRIRENGPLPMFTSCSPGWVKLVEQEYPELIEHISSCRSPQQMMGSVLKRLHAPEQGIDSAKLFSVAIMPCTAKKFEAERPEMCADGLPDVDAVLTTRELARLLNRLGIRLDAVKAEEPDHLLNLHSGAGKIFGTSGGVMTAALRTAAWMLTGKEHEAPALEAVEGHEGLSRATVEISGKEIGVAVASGTQAARRLIQEMKAGLHPDLQFIEVMTCPGGCISGGGQPRAQDPEVLRSRMLALRGLDKAAGLRQSHNNPDLQELYRRHLDHPGSKTSHHLLHTSYRDRGAERKQSA